MKSISFPGKVAFVLNLFFIMLVGVFPSHGQTVDFAAERERAVKLVNEGKFYEAIPLLEKLSADPKADGQIFLGLGVAYLKQSEEVNSKTQARQMRLKAREFVLKARDMGASIPELDAAIAAIRPDGSSSNESDNPQAQEAYEQAFPAFASGDYKKAAEAYGKAAALDLKWYEAALYTGNSYYALKEYDKAGEWFAKAIAINPNRETAYRYWADGLMNSGKNKEAEDKFLEAIIAEPYNSFPWRGLTNYAQRNNLKPAHPKIDIPVNISSSEKGNLNITLGTGDKTDDGSFAWMAYGLSRAVWQPEKTGKLSERFTRAYPKESVYRHSLAEEVDALQSVLSGLKNGKKEIKILDPSLALLKKINDAGLLEPFILLSRSDAGIRNDYEKYRQNNRDKLKRYLSEIIMKGGGN